MVNILMSSALFPCLVAIYLIFIIICKMRTRPSQLSKYGLRVLGNKSPFRKQTLAMRLSPLPFTQRYHYWLSPQRTDPFGEVSLIRLATQYHHWRLWLLA